MFMMWFFWLFVLIGGWLMGGFAIRAGLAHGFTADVVLNIAAWLGCGLYAVPRVWRLITKPAPRPAAH